MSDTFSDPASFGSKGAIALFYGSLLLGGTAKVIVNLANELAARGEAVDVVLISKSGAYLDAGLLDERVRVVGLGYASHRGIGIWPLFRYLMRDRPRVLVAMLTVNILRASVAVVMEKLLRLNHATPVIYVEHQSLEADLVNINHPKWRRKLLQGLFLIAPMLAFRTADKMVTVAEHLRDELASRLYLKKETITTIYNPVIDDALAERAKEPVTHPWFDANRPCPVLLSVGRLASIKRYDLLIDAFALVRKQMPARLMILGEGDLRPNLEAQIAALGLQNDVTLPGFVDNPAAYMARADLFVLSSKRECLPVALTEALAVGCPIVSLDCPFGPREIMEQSRYGILVEEDSAEALAQGMLHALQNPDMMQDKCADFAANRAKDFSIQPVADRYLAIIESVS